MDDGFNNQEKGLFTFYREQAELQEKVKEAKKLQQKKKKQVRKTQIKEDVVQLKKIKRTQNNRTPINKKSMTERAKQHIKSIESKVMRKGKNKYDEQVKNGDEKEKVKNYYSIDFKKVNGQEKNGLQSISSEIFMNKKQYVGKSIPFDKRLIKIKEISSQIFDNAQIKNEDEILKQKKKKSQRKYHKERSKVTTLQEERLPIINKLFSNKNFDSFLQPRRRSKDLTSNYKSKDIVENNRKFDIGNPVRIKSNFILSGQQNNMEQVKYAKQQKVLDILNKFQLNM